MIRNKLLDSLDNGGSIGWCLIPPTIVARRDLSLMEKYLLGRIVGLIGSKGYCYASNAWLGAQLGAAKGTVANLLSKLGKRHLVRIEVIYTSRGEVEERRIYLSPVLLWEGGYSLRETDLRPTQGIPLHQPVKAPLHRTVKVEGRDSRVEISKKNTGETGSPADPGGLSIDRGFHQGARPEAAESRLSDVLSHPGKSAGSLPYLPRNFPVDHPVCRVLSRFADRWAAMSGEVLDVSIARAIKEIQQRLKTTPLDDLLRLVDLWFDPGLSWVSLAERGAFHTFIQPRAVSELKGIKAGLSTAPAGRRERAGYIKPLTHDEWADIPSGQLSFSQGRVVYHGNSPDGPAAGDRVSPDGLEANTWH